MGTLTHAVYPNIEVNTTFFDKVALACAHGAHFKVKFDENCPEMLRSPGSIEEDGGGLNNDLTPSPTTVRDALKKKSPSPPKAKTLLMQKTPCSRRRVFNAS